MRRVSKIHNSNFPLTTCMCISALVIHAHQDGSANIYSEELFFIRPRIRARGISISRVHYHTRPGPPINHEKEIRFTNSRT